MTRGIILPRFLAATLMATLGVTLLVAVAVSAQSPQQTYDLSWWTVDGGGGGSSGGNYALDGTAGQPDPGPILSGGGYNLEGGFWGGGLSGASWYYIYLPLVLRND
jgi:hypothetical protein